MTLLHQAAQKAVEALRLILPMAKGYAYNTHRVKANEDMCDQAAASLAALESALQQQPEPVALERWGRAKRDGSVLLERMADGYWTPWHIAQQALSALQHQEVPSGETEAQREEVCKAWADLPDSLRCHPSLKRLYRALGGVRLDAPAEAVPPEVPREPVAWLYTRVEDGRRILAFAPNPDSAGKWEPLYASPSTTRQQEVGSGWKLVPVEPTPGMIAAYLQANDAYWKRTDELPTPPDKWRTGTPSEATAESYHAMLAAAPSTPEKAGGARCAHHPSKCPHWEDCRARQECVGALGVNASGDAQPKGGA